MPSSNITFSNWCNVSQNRNPQVVVAEVSSSWIVSTPTLSLLVPEILLHIILAKSLCQDTLKSFTQREFCQSNRLDCYLQSFACLNGQGHFSPLVWSERASTNLSGGKPISQIPEKYIVKPFKPRICGAPIWCQQSIAFSLMFMKGTNIQTIKEVIDHLT